MSDHDTAWQLRSCGPHLPGILAISLILSACGGGSGGSDAAPAPTAAAPVTPVVPAPAPPVIPAPAPVPDPVPAPAAITTAEAYRFLNQATFGATAAEAQRVITLGYAAWIDDQLAKAPSTQLLAVQTAYAALTNPAAMVGSVNNDRTEAWLRNSTRGDDQLRQRLAFALSEIMVVSQASALVNMPQGLADYYDMLARNAFGDFRVLIEDVTLHPTMGVYLSMLGNQKPDAARNIRPDENYARELMQLFTIGLVELNIDGSVKRDAQSQPLPTYNQEIIEGFANVFTGWNYTDAATFAAARRSITTQIKPMKGYPEQHSPLAKKLLPVNGAAVTLAAAQTPVKDLADALDNITNHPNVAPFIARQLIQRLVTSNPSPAFIERVARKFNDDGAGKRGNLAAVVRAILLDTEARAAPATATAGKLKEPLLRLTQLWRAYDAKATTGKYAITPASLSGTFGQAPLNSGSVFNFFSPFYAPPGEIGDANLVAPELQLATEYLNTTVSNYLYQQTFCYVPVQVAGCAALRPETIVLDNAAEIALAANSDALIERIAGKLLGGPPSATLKTEAKIMVDRLAVTATAQRVAEAMYLIVTSPEYAQQR